MQENYVKFGQKNVKKQDKQKLVNNVFDTVASKYDIMNDLMSLGIQRYWKKRFLAHCKVADNQMVLDLASGTCDIVRQLSEIINPKRIYASDINANMLKVGQEKLINNGIIIADYIQLNAEHLPFSNESFGLITISFGLRNTTDKLKVLQEAYRCLKPGGRLAILEFSKPDNPMFKKIYNIYNSKVLPALGRVVANSKDSYSYLADSIETYLSPEQVLNLLKQAGFSDNQQINLTNGIVAIHLGYK